MTDIAPGWTINQSVPNRARKRVVEAIDHAASQFPFPIKGIDSDNGSEFINHQPCCVSRLMEAATLSVNTASIKLEMQQSLRLIYGV